MSRAPWDRQWLGVTPKQFEEMVVRYIQPLGGSLENFKVDHRPHLSGQDGEFELDALAQFEALGAHFLVVVECKHHRNPVKRELVQVLRDRVRSLSAHKGILFSTGGFQKGAIEYALSQRIALVHFTEGGPLIETRSARGSDGPKRAYDTYFVSLNERGNLSYQAGEISKVRDYLFSDEESGREAH